MYAASQRWCTDSYLRRNAVSQTRGWHAKCVLVADVPGKLSARDGENVMCTTVQAIAIAHGRLTSGCSSPSPVSQRAAGSASSSGASARPLPSHPWQRCAGCCSECQTGLTRQRSMAQERSRLNHSISSCISRPQTDLRHILLKVNWVHRTTISPETVVAPVISGPPSWVGARQDVLATKQEAVPLGLETTESNIVQLDVELQGWSATFNPRTAMVTQDRTHLAGPPLLPSQCPIAAQPPV